MGETREEVHERMEDLRSRRHRPAHHHPVPPPLVRHHPIERWVKPEEFVELRDEAADIGFAGVMSGPLVRSSYRAGRLYQQALDSRRPADATSVS